MDEMARGIDVSKPPLYLHSCQGRESHTFIISYNHLHSGVEQLFFQIPEYDNGGLHVEPQVEQQSPFQ